jgi:hypothetical protein
MSDVIVKPLIKYFFFNEGKVLENRRPESLARHPTSLAYFRDQQILVEYTHTCLHNLPAEGDALRGASADVVYIRYEGGYNNPAAWLPKIDEAYRPQLEDKLAAQGLTIDDIKEIYQVERKTSFSRWDYKSVKKRELRYTTVRHLRARDPRYG